MKVATSIDGSVLAPDPNVRRVEDHVSVVETLVRDGYEIGTVVGGGGIAHDYIGAARNLSMSETQLDRVGINVARINARLLITALGSQVDPKIAHGYKDAGDVIRCGNTSVMGSVMPGQATNVVAATFAEYINTDLLVYATSVNGVFSADPDSSPNAAKSEETTAVELVDIIGDIEMNAGSSAPVGFLAAKLIERAKTRTIILDGTDPDRITPAVPRGKRTGTDIIPEGGDGPTYRAP